MCGSSPAQTFAGLLEEITSPVVLEPKTAITKCNRSIPSELRFLACQHFHGMTHKQDNAIMMALRKGVSLMQHAAEALTERASCLSQTLL